MRLTMVNGIQLRNIFYAFRNHIGDIPLAVKVKEPCANVFIVQFFNVHFHPVPAQAFGQFVCVWGAINLVFLPVSNGNVEPAKVAWLGGHWFGK